MTVVGYADLPGWFSVRKSHVTGVADGTYLQRVNAPDPGTDEDDAELPETHEPEDVLYMAKVVNVRTGLNLREQPSMSGKTLLLMPKDAVVEVLKDNLDDGFAMVYYAGVYGFCTRSYLYQLEEEGPKYFDVALHGVTADIVAQIMKIYPSAEVTERSDG